MTNLLAAGRAAPGGPRPRGRDAGLQLSATGAQAKSPVQRPRNPLLCPAGAGWLGHRRRLCGEGSSGRNCCSRVFSAISLFPRPPNLAFQPRLTACTFPPRPLHLSPERHEHDQPSEPHLSITRGSAKLLPSQSAFSSPPI